MTTILAFLFVLGVLVFVHELGHFLVARWHGVRVHTFSLGFGPKLFSFRRGDTEYCVSVVPLGGYVKLAGENAMEEEPNGTTDPLASDQFMAKSKWVRFQVYVAGPVMNILLAHRRYRRRAEPGADIPLYESAPAGDRRRSRPGKSRRDRRPARRRSRGQRGRRADVHAGMSSNGRAPQGRPRAAHSSRIVTASGYRFGSPRWRSAATRWATLASGPVLRPQITQVNPGSPAEQAGFERGDVLLAVNGDARPAARGKIIERIRASADAPLDAHGGARRTAATTSPSFHAGRRARR